MYFQDRRAGMRISGFEWDDGNVLHFTLGHGIEPEEAEEVFAVAPCFRRTRRGHYAAFGPTAAGRLLVIVFAIGPRGVVRAITGWDMDTAERRYYRRQRGS
ncbi:MAG: BrnT family toxin [Gemmatimonadota bacterium]